MSGIVYLCGCISAIFAAAGIIGKIFVWMKRILAGERCQLRTLMLRTYYENQAERRLRQYEYENFEKSYEAYKALGGNSFIDKVRAEVLEWEIE